MTITLRLNRNAMSRETENLLSVFALIIPINFIILINHYLFFHGYFSWFTASNLEHVNLLFARHIHYVRAIYVLLVIIGTFTNSSLSNRSENNIIFVILSILTIALFFLGFNSFPLYNLAGYPVIILLMTYSLIKSIRYIQFNSANGGEDKLFGKTKASKESFRLDTAKGPLHITKPEYGIGIEGGAGAGKSVLIKNFLHQAGLKGYGGVLYDFEGDCREPGGAELTRTIMSSIAQYNKGKKQYGSLGFAYMNFGDPSRTVRVNPLSPKYIDSELVLNEFAITLMKNLNPDWLKRTDFWADNAINYAQGILLRLYRDRSLWKYLNVPHLAMICNTDYETVFNWMLQDSSLEKMIMPLHVAWREQAKSQIAGAVSSAALPITKILSPEILYPLSPQSEAEEFDLDITNNEHPVFFSIGTIPKFKFSLGPICSLVLLVCMNNMNRFGKRRSLFVVDELPTIFVPNLDNLPATARKKKVGTILAWQSYSQLENAYGKEKASITRDNLSNQFVGKGRNIESAERIIKYFGKKDIYKESFSQSLSGDSVSYQSTKEDRLQASQIVNQPIGHFTGVLPEGDPPYFHTQFDYFEPKLLNIPVFSKKWNTSNDELDSEMMRKEVEENYIRIEREVNMLLEPYKKV